MINIRKPFLYLDRSVVLHCGTGVTKQSFAKDADINFIVAKAARTGSLVDPMSVARRQHTFMDVSMSGDYLSQMLRLKSIQDSFMELDSATRSRFGNSAELLLDFVHDPLNEDECIKLGLLPKKVMPIQPVVSSEVSAVLPVV